MKKNLCIGLLATLALTATAQQTITVSVSNTSKSVRTDEPVVIPIAKYGDIRSALVTENGKEIACQLDDLDQNETFDELCFLADLKGKEQKQYTVTLYTEGEPRHYPARVFAEMLVRNDKVKEKNKHNNFLESITVRGDCANSYNIQHHHGVDFESELNGIRIYFDKRQTLDLYGKFLKRLELEATQFYTTKAQKAEGYGDDVLWVGETFGLGTLRGWDGQQPTMIKDVAHRGQRIVARGPLRTVVEVKDEGWKQSAGSTPVDMTTLYTLYAGRRDCRVDVSFSRAVPDLRFATGVINVKNSVEHSDHKGLRGCWGTDWPVSEKDSAGHKRETVGLGICLPQENVSQELPADKNNYPYVVSIPSDHLTYYITFGSDNESFGMHSAKEWFAYLEEWKKSLAQQVDMRLK